MTSSRDCSLAAVSPNILPWGCRRALSFDAIAGRPTGDFGAFMICDVLLGVVGVASASCVEASALVERGPESLAGARDD